MTVDLLAWWVYAVAALGILAVVVVFHLFVKTTATEDSFARRHGLWGLIIGVDGRTSTSKLQAALWTAAIVYALLVLLIGGRVDDFVDHLQEEYLLLLGGPYAAAIGAKAITSAKDSDGSAPKTEAPEAEGGVSARVAEVVSDDSGQTDLGDFQYFAFTLVALAYFFVKFVSDPANGLPEMPGTLVGLTSASALAYLTKKGVYSQVASVRALSPQKAGPGDRVRIFGANLLGPEQRGGAVALPTPYGGEVLFGGAAAQDVRVCESSAAHTKLEAVVPPGAPSGSSDVVVIPATGAPTEPKPFEVTLGVELSSVSPSRVILGETTEVVIAGSGFVVAEKGPTELNAVHLDGVELPTSDWTAGSVRAQLLGAAIDLKLMGLGENPQAEIVVLNHAGSRSVPKSVAVEEADVLDASP